MLPGPGTQLFGYVIVGAANIHDAKAILLSASKRIIAGASLGHDFRDLLRGQAVGPISVGRLHDFHALTAWRLPIRRPAASGCPMSEGRFRRAPPNGFVFLSGAQHWLRDTRRGCFRRSRTHFSPNTPLKETSGGFVFQNEPTCKSLLQTA
jgi:hypothetical protein